MIRLGRRSFVAGATALAAGGLHGVYPSRTDLQDGDLKHTVDFRSVFATVARDWWGVQRDFGLRQPQKLGFIA